jgi:SAM-dependent methyltransferase
MPLILRRATSGPTYDWEHLLASFCSFVKPNSTVLEIGASVPSRTRQLASRCAAVIGIEFFPDRVPQKTGENIRYVVGDWQKLTNVVGLESIDLAISSHVIEHVPDDLAAIDELYAVLKPGGVALINTPNRKRLVRSIIECFTGERRFPWWEHVREYTEPDLQRLLERSKFSRYEIAPVALGVQGGPVYFYSTWTPVPARRLANFWEVHLFK